MGTPSASRHTPWAEPEDAARYERGRPDYPAALTTVLTEQLSLRRNGRVLDVAAGTGKLTRILARGPARVTAIEPQRGMRRELSRRVPTAAVVAGLAESLPLRTGSMHAITVGQAFHWFAVERASREFRRVLRPGGRLAVISNQRHEPAPWVKKLWAVLGDYERLAPDPGSNREWRSTLAATGDFSPLDRLELPNEQRFDDLADFDARFTSVSFVMLLEPSAQASLVRELHAVVAGIDPIVIPLHTVVEVATRLG
jgi:SAM-dependent methyltransferase